MLEKLSGLDLVMSMRIFPPRLAGPARSIASSAAVPRVARAVMSPWAAA